MSWLPLAACAIGLRAAPEEGCVLLAAPRTVGNDALWSLAAVSTSEPWATAASSLVWLSPDAGRGRACRCGSEDAAGRHGVEAASEPRAASALGTASTPGFAVVGEGDAGREDAIALLHSEAVGMEGVISHRRSASLAATLVCGLPPLLLARLFHPSCVLF